VLHARDVASLASAARRIAGLAPALSDTELHDLASQLGRQTIPAGGYRLGIVARGQQQLAARATEAAALLPTVKPGQLAVRPGIFAGNGTRGRVTLLFPGLGTGQDAGESPGASAPPPLFGLIDPEAVQPAVLHAALSGLRWLDRLGVAATAAVGHSLGEIAALVWAGALTEADATRLVAQRSAVIRASGLRQTAMVSVAADAATSKALCVGTDLVIAAYNGPNSHVIAGPATSVREVTRRARQQGLAAVVLDVSHAFHSPAMTGCVAPLRAVLHDITLGPPRRRIASTVTGRIISPGDDIARLLCAGLTSPVRFTDALAAVAADADLLCETGPGHGLAALAAAACDVPAVSLETRTADDRGAAQASAALFAAGAVNSLEPIMSGRPDRPVNIWPERFATPTQAVPTQTLPAQTPPVQTPPVQTPPVQTPSAQIPPVQAARVQTVPPPVAPAPVASAPAGPAPIRAVPPAPARAWFSRTVSSQGESSQRGSADVIPITKHEPARPSWRGRFLQDVRLHRPGAELIADTRLSVETDPYLADYRIDGQGVLPPVMGLEAMAQVASALTGRPMRRIAHISFDSPVCVPAETAHEVLVRVCAKREGKRITAVLRTREAGQWVDHAKASFPLRATESAPHGATAPNGQTAARGRDTRRMTANDGGAGLAGAWQAFGRTTGILDSADLYGSICFQAGRFRRVAFLPELTSRRCRALVRGGDDQPWFGPGIATADEPLLLGSPGLNDATLHALQACFPHRRMRPAGCDAVTVSGRTVTGAVEVRAWQRAVTRADGGGPQATDEYLWDVTAVDATGQPIVTWTGLRLREAGPVPGNPPLPPALLGVYLERGATALGLDPALRISVRCEQPQLGPTLGAARAPVVAGPSRRPGWVSARSRGQLDELSLRLRGASPAACAWETADLDQDAAGQPTDPEDPEFEALRQRLRDSLAEPTPTVRARIRTAIECLSKAGRPVGCELVVDGCYDNGWALLHAGDAVIACTSVRVSGVSSPVAVSIMTGTGMHAAGAA
jgi:malonyl CoA-acyl carrier protein transacylase